jgi:hypothetical protein
MKNFISVILSLTILLNLFIPVEAANSSVSNSEFE